MMAKNLIFLNLTIILLIGCQIQETTTRYWDRFFHALPGSFRNDDTNRNIEQLIESRGFLFENHFVHTPDGYILRLVRIKNPFYLTENNSTKMNLKPILLHHGFQCTGTFWLITRNGTLQSDGTYKEFKYNDEDDDDFDENNFPTNQTITTNQQDYEKRKLVGDTLAFVLASNGYDVWLANYRGSIYSTNHSKLSTNSKEFWSFSIDEMILYDLPALIDYILEETDYNSLSYIGHSQGNLMMFALMSISDFYTKLIKPFIAISPVFYNSNIKGALLTLIPMIDYLRSYPTFVPYSTEFKKFFANMCENILTRRFCLMAFYRFTGAQLKNLNWPRLTVYMANLAMGSSSWNAAQLLQLYSRTDGQPSAFDLGDQIKNLDRYAQFIPPIYNASKINSTDIALIYSINDWLNPLENIVKLKQNLPFKPIVDYQINDTSYGHLELVWAKNAGQTVNWKVLDILSKY